MKDGPQEQMKQFSQDAGGPVAENDSKKRRTKQGYGGGDRTTVICHPVGVEGDMSNSVLVWLSLWMSGCLYKLWDYFPTVVASLIIDVVLT